MVLESTPIGKTAQLARDKAGSSANEGDPYTHT